MTFIWAFRYTHGQFQLALSFFTFYAPTVPPSSFWLKDYHYSFDPHSFSSSEFLNSSLVGWSWLWVCQWFGWAMTRVDPFLTRVWNYEEYLIFWLYTVFSLLIFCAYSRLSLACPPLQPISFPEPFIWQLSDFAPFNPIKLCIYSPVFCTHYSWNSVRFSIACFVMSNLWRVVLFIFLIFWHSCGADGAYLFRKVLVSHILSTYLAYQ